MDDDWSVTFRYAMVNFTNRSVTDFPGGEPDPELYVEYNSSHPLYCCLKQQVLLAPDCVDASHDGAAIYPADPRDIVYDSDNRVLGTWYYINTSAIENSGDFWNRTSATQGIIDLCARVELVNEQNYSMAVETTRITINVDTTTDFQVTGVNYANEALTEAQQEVRVDYPLDVSFCDDNNEATPAPTLIPGQPLRVCVKTVGSDALVADVRSVDFENSLAGLTLQVIDDLGDESNGQTNKTCDAGVCNIQTVTFSSLYQSEINGVLEDVTNATTMVGTAVLKFGNPSSRRLLDHRQGRHLNAGRRIVQSAVTGFDLDLGGSLQQLPADGGLGGEGTLTSGPASLVGGAVTIGAGMAIAALVAVVVALVVHQYRRQKKTTQLGPMEQAATAKGMAMI